MVKKLQEEIKMGIRFHDRMGNYYKIVQKAYAVDNHAPLYLCQELEGEYELLVWKEDDLKSCLIAENLYEESEEKTQKKTVSLAYKKASAALNGAKRDQSWSESMIESLEEDNEEEFQTRLQKKVMQFLDEDSYVIKLEILSELRGKLNRSMMETLAISLDFDLGEGSLEDQYFSLTQYLKTKIRYEQPRRY